ncbi:hypothetical protein EDB82DRAFT_566564 [Fusarium venenatum]|uniref:uncharacterized protein n=1 Tax=Fusarium venenatum TaxID=56646 RepID=UPI001D7C5428|nr:hypothetical protein EDB82DRAFT_566564 [Fusarium venenatum]
MGWSWFILVLLGLVQITVVYAQLVTGPTAQGLVDAALDALGGRITFHAPSIYRSRSLMQSYQLTRADTSVMTSGSQNIPYRLDAEVLQQRIDRHATPSNSWAWGSPDLKPVDFSLVVQDGADGFACYTKGNNMIHVPYNVTFGYTDESHPIYGTATKDLYLSEYKEVEGIEFPRLRLKVTLNPDFPAGYFDGIPEDQSLGPKTPPEKSSLISNGLVTDYSSSMLGSGIAQQPLKIVRAENPVRGLSQVHWLVLNDRDDLGFKMVIIEFDKEVILCDAPPDWSDTIKQWVSENLKKPITFVAPSHHHRDHSGGIRDFAQAGVKSIILEIAVDHWSSVCAASFITFNQSHPYTHTDGTITAWFNWEAQTAHASDWTYVFFTELCASADSPVIAFEADSWKAGLDAELSNQGQTRQWLDQIVSDGLPQHTIVFPSHGKITPLEQLLEITAYLYPNFDVTNWRNGAAICS